MTSSSEKIDIETSRRTFSEQVHTQYQTLPVSIGGSVVSVTCYSLAMTVWQPVSSVLLWYLAMLLQFAIRAWGLKRYRLRCQQGPLSDDEVHAWGRYATWGSLVSGSLWGFVAVVFFPPTGSEHAQYQYLLMMMLSGMGTAAAFAQASYPLAFRAFMLPSSIPFTILLFAQGTTMHTIYGMTSILYMLSVDRFVAVLNRSILDAFRLRFTNEYLVNRLASQNGLLEEASAAKSKFLASASHDLRQPLHAMELFTEALQHANPAPNTLWITEKLRLSVAAMRSLLDALLDISKLDAGVVTPQPAAVALSPLLHLLHDEFQGQARAKGLSLRLRVSPGATTSSDPVLLKSIVGNLISNAVRYTAHGGILICCRSCGPQWSIDVIDTGIGIPAEQQQTVFKEFVQLHNPQRDREQGLGLGLAIVARLCSLLGHTLILKSTTGRGSRFRVQVDKVAPTSVPVLRSPPHSVELEAGALVVVVDDERDVREAMHAMLAAWGLRSICQPDADSAVAALEAETSIPLLIISDYRLGSLFNGIDAITKIRDEYNIEDLAALLITGDTASQDLLTVQASGIAVMHKPVDTKKLKTLLQELSLARCHDQEFMTKVPATTHRDAEQLPS